MKRAAALFFFLALPAMADTQFRARQMNRNDVPPGQGQCDIRLQVDGEVEVSVRGQTVFVRTISGREARDDGSECNAPLPEGNLRGFNFEVKDQRGYIAGAAQNSVIWARSRGGGVNCVVSRCGNERGMP